MAENSVVEPVERRTFLRYALGGAMGLSVAGGSVGFIGMLWPSLGGGFGADITLPEPAEDIYEQIISERAPYEYPAGRMYVVAWDPSVQGAEEAYGAEHSTLDETRGLMALYVRAPGLCRGGRARSGRSARATARSTTSGASGSAVLRRAASTASRRRWTARAT